MSKISPALRDALERLDALYAQLPTIVCQGRCHITCTSIPISHIEARRLQLVTHVKPRTTADGHCIYLTEKKRCGVYALRPLVCRVWGVVKTLSCMYGCVPDRWLKEPEFANLAREIERLGGGRILFTVPEGVADTGDSFEDLLPNRPVDDIEVDAERTRNLRALHGGRILGAFISKDK